MTVIWVARPPQATDSLMVGWYENALVYRVSQQFLDDKNRILPNGSYAYFVSANELDCHLTPTDDDTISPEENALTIPIIPRGPGGFGRSSIWYADGALGDRTKSAVINFITKRKALKRK